MKISRGIKETGEKFLFIEGEEGENWFNTRTDDFYAAILIKKLEGITSITVCYDKVYGYMHDTRFDMEIKRLQDVTFNFDIPKNEIQDYIHEIVIAYNSWKAGIAFKEEFEV